MTAAPALPRTAADARPMAGDHRPPPDVARSWLLVPGRPDSPDALDAAAASRADAIILDLEDGLPAPLRPEGRRTVRSWLSTHRAWVRISTAGTPDWSDDLTAIADAPGLAGIVLAKTESPVQIAATLGRLGARVPVVALVESALGVENASEIARRPGCARLAFGLGDFRRDTGVSADPMALAYARGRLVVSSRAAGLPAPIDGPTLKNAGERLDEETQVTASMGMTARLCLDADHAARVNELLGPSPDDIASAQETVAQLGDGGDLYDGSALPMLGRAESVLERATRLGLLDD
ncbi:HpcH/HpaI aldolase/citrate lyase family protein [Williamsia serinedens]|uniref:Citrate lyase subunit beta / citryl-CoA lyase n=1 Tax=Williamsia serinedens TaxID=391736 RepID=A0ABT1H1U4_9NOCA|nr:aldolase/citrate lyase family protein [Williamsia serinedens]MCP2159772.1 citrate lyase subunit beta / citryl-CoA lyase [Williamsia serinedens]